MAETTATKRDWTDFDRVGALLADVAKLVKKAGDDTIKLADSTILAHESGELDNEATIELFQHLVDTGLAFQLQGHYGRAAMQLIDKGQPVEHRYLAKAHNPVITCTDGFTISVQGRGSAYCLPREDYPDTPYTHVECSYPSTTPMTSELRELAELTGGRVEGVHDRWAETVYPYTPIAVIQAELDAHGGIANGCMP